MRNKIATVAVGLLLAASTPVLGAGQDRNPEWVRKPTPEELFSVFPGPAVQQRISGEVVIECEVAIDGTLRACQSVRETPPDMGFGAAALALTPQFLMRPALRAGVPVVARIRTTIVFKVPGSSRRPARPSPSRRASDAGAQTSAGPRMFTRMGWIAAPSRAEVAAAYPAGATGAGYALLECAFRQDGTLAHCKARKEEPKGQRFGAAARSLAGRFKAAVNVVGGKPIGGEEVLVDIRFDPPGSPDPGISSQIEWVAQPSPEQLAFPQEARAAGVASGKGVIDCLIQTGGVLGDCQLVSETPAGRGFGAAALSLAPHFRANPWIAGRPTEGRRISLPIEFRN